MKRKAINSPKKIKKLNEENINLIYHVANKIARSHKCDADDLVSYGFLGLNRASELYDESTGYAFSTYAVPKIRGAILDGIRNEKPWSVRLEKDRSVYAKAKRDIENMGHTFNDEMAMNVLGWNKIRVLQARTLLEPVIDLPDTL
jgi:RNA polymerase sigma factor for flagellar operon FliA